MQESKPPLPFSLLLLLHGQLQYLPLQLSQQTQQGLDFGSGHAGQAHAGGCGMTASGSLSSGSDVYAGIFPCQRIVWD